jgi:hypothetical protein
MPADVAIRAGYCADVLLVLAAATVAARAAVFTGFLSSTAASDVARAALHMGAAAIHAPWTATANGFTTPVAAAAYFTTPVATAA